MNLKVKFWLFSSILLVFILLFFGIGTLYFIKFLPSTIGEYLSIIIYRYLQVIFFSTFFFILFYIFISFIIYSKYIVPFYILTEEARLISKTNPSHRISIKGCREVCELSDEINKLASVIESSAKELELKFTEHIKHLFEKKKFLESIINNLHLGIIICDFGGTILFYNNFARLLLMSRGGLISIGRSIFDFLDKKGLEDLIDELNRSESKNFKRCSINGFNVELGVLEVDENLQLKFLMVIVKGESKDLGKDTVCLCSVDELLFEHDISINEVGQLLEVYDSCLCTGFDCICVDVKDLWNTNLRDLFYTVFDLETTGLRPFEGDEIVSISAVRVINGKILTDEAFHLLVNPKRSIPEDSIKIHGITPDMVRDKPSVEEGLRLFFEYSKGSVLVGYNALFDRAFIQKKEARANVKFENPILDILLLSVVVHPHQKDHSLESIAKRVGAKIYPRHTSYGDALTCAEVLVKLFPLLEDKGIYTLKDAWKQMQKIKFYSKKYLNLMPA